MNGIYFPTPKEIIYVSILKLSYREHIAIDLCFLVLHAKRISKCTI